MKTKTLTILTVLMLVAANSAMANDNLDWTFDCGADQLCSGSGTIFLEEDGSATAEVLVENTFVLHKNGETVSSTELIPLRVELDAFDPALRKVGGTARVHDLNATRGDKRLAQVRGAWNEVVADLELSGSCDNLAIGFPSFSDPLTGDTSTSTAVFYASNDVTCDDDNLQPQVIGEVVALYMRLCAKTHNAQVNQCNTSCGNACGENGVASSSYQGGNCGSGGTCTCSCNSPASTDGD